MSKKFLTDTFFVIEDDRTGYIPSPSKQSTSAILYPDLGMAKRFARTGQIIHKVELQVLVSIRKEPKK